MNDGQWLGLFMRLSHFIALYVVKLFIVSTVHAPHIFMPVIRFDKFGEPENVGPYLVEMQFTLCSLFILLLIK